MAQTTKTLTSSVKGGTPGTAYGTVAAGDSIILNWGSWNDGHHGPIINYLASCNGSCTDMDKTQLKFVKIAGEGLLQKPGSDAQPAPPPGYWATDRMIEDTATWTLQVPRHFAPGKYILRHEIIALQVAYAMPGAQHYPQCFNLEITGDGDQQPIGTPANQLYNEDDPGIHIDIREPVNNYTVPGPPQYIDNGLTTNALIDSPSSSSLTDLPATETDVSSSTLTPDPSQASLSSSDSVSTTSPSTDAIQTDSLSTPSGELPSSTIVSSSDSASTTSPPTDAIQTDSSSTPSGELPSSTIDTSASASVSAYVINPASPPPSPSLPPPAPITGCHHHKAKMGRRSQDHRCYRHKSDDHQYNSVYHPY